MKIAAVVVTCERLELLPRALKSVALQVRQPDFVIVISNSQAQNLPAEKALCESYAWQFTANKRTKTYAGALNTGVQEIVQQLGVGEDVYFASLDDDDEWLPDYLETLEIENTGNFDMLIGNLQRKSATEDHLLALPSKLTPSDFLTGNPGVSGSNTFIRLRTLLTAGAFDEAMMGTTDRDFMVRVLLQKPSYNVIGRHLVNQYTDLDRPRITTSGKKKEESLILFYYKYRNLMGEEEKARFKQRAKSFFNVNAHVFEEPLPKTAVIHRSPLHFGKKNGFEFIIGFITGAPNLCQQVLNEIVVKKISPDLVLIIDNTGPPTQLLEIDSSLTANDIPYRIVHADEWKQNLQNGHYGFAFKKFKSINSIPLGRSVLHHHLYEESMRFSRPVFWIIDDDVTFEHLAPTALNKNESDLFSLISSYHGKVDAIIGGVSNDPPLPFLSTLRCQLIDFYYSYLAEGKRNEDALKIQAHPDYYYDLSDLRTDHLEFPIYHSHVDEGALAEIFSGKGVSRKALQNETGEMRKSISQRGPNTLVFNRELLKEYPVINLSVNQKYARRGDLLWAIFNQLVQGFEMIEHSLSVQQNRPITEFKLERELEKSAYDIIGYAINKALQVTIHSIRANGTIAPQSIVQALQDERNFQPFRMAFLANLNRRKARFLMNYFRIIGLTKQLSHTFMTAERASRQFEDLDQLAIFMELIDSSQNLNELKSFLQMLQTNFISYRHSFEPKAQMHMKAKKVIESWLGSGKLLSILGTGEEGLVLTDKVHVYKVFDAISDKNWQFLKDKAKAACFSSQTLLEQLDFFEIEALRFIRYPFHPFTELRQVEWSEIIDFLKFCKKNEILFTNLKPSNFIQKMNGEIKYIDYGRSISSFDSEIFINVCKRAFLLTKHPTMQEEQFRKITQQINQGVIPSQINGWEELYKAANQ